MRKKKSGIIAVLMFCITGAGIAGTDPSAFLNTGVGARALGMGGAFVSIGDDPTAMYWNPAGLGKINRMSVTAMGQSLGSTEWDTLSDIYPGSQFVGVTFPVNSFHIPGLNNESNTFGIGMMSTGLDNVSYTSVDGAGNIVRDTFEDSEKAYFISYGFPLMTREDNLFAGATFKYITQQFSKVSGANASGYDFDVGVIYGIGNLSLGAVIQRGVQLTWANGHKDTGPLVTKFGVSNLFPIKGAFSILGSADLVQRQGEPTSLNAGAEMSYKSDIGVPRIVALQEMCLRAGVDSYTVEDRYGYREYINNNLNYTLGAGAKVTLAGYLVSVDYSMGSYRLGGRNRFSVTMYFK